MAASPALIPVCEMCFQDGKGTGGLRQVGAGVFCASCARYGALLVGLGIVVGRESGPDVANKVIQWGTKAIGYLIENGCPPTHPATVAQYLDS